MHMLRHHIMQVYGEVEILLEIILAATTSAVVTEKSLSLLGIKSQPVTCQSFCK